MKVLTRNECEAWCGTRGVQFEKNRQSFVDQVEALEFGLPSVGLEIIGLSHVLSTALETDAHVSSLLWLRSWYMWSEDFDAIGAAVWNSLMKAQGEVPVPAGSNHGALFSANELREQEACLVAALLFQWDAYLVPDHARHVIRMSHDGFIRVEGRTSADLSRLESSLSGWNPTRFSIESVATNEP